MKLPIVTCDLTMAHWGTYEIDRDAGGELRSWREDPDPSPIGHHMRAAYGSALRIRNPAVRSGWLRDRRKAGRGQESFVEVSWDTALELVATELSRVIGESGNHAVFGGSYGWSSAGRFHHALSQVHRFLNSTGGYVRQTDSYSLGAGRVVMPHIVAEMDVLKDSHTSWEILAEHTRLFVAFGGVPVKNSQISSGGVVEHHASRGLDALLRNGCRFVHFSPVRSDLPVPDEAVEWIQIRPNTDTAAILGMAYELISCGLHDTAFLSSHTVGFETWQRYLTGHDDGIPKTPEWAASITGVPAAVLRRVAHELVSNRSIVNAAWSLQRADHGEQPFWAVISLAALIGQIGLPGGGFGVGYGPANVAGSPYERIRGPVFPQGKNYVDAFIPCARIADMLLHPGKPFDYNGSKHIYPNVRLIYWAGGNPFHHHQDLHRLTDAWSRPETIIVHEQTWNYHARMADIVLPATTTLERNDIGFSSREPLLIAMKAVDMPPGQARDDYDIFADLAYRLDCGPSFTEGRTSTQWLAHIYDEWDQMMKAQSIEVPSFDEFWIHGGIRLPRSFKPAIMLRDFRQDPERHPLKTPSGKIEIFSQRVASFDYSSCPGYPKWIEPTEWLGAPLAEQFPLHMLSDQPATKLHSQLDFSDLSKSQKIHTREPIMISTEDAGTRGITSGDVVRVFNDRGACLAGAIVTDDIRQGVVKMSTGAWWDPEVPGDRACLDRHGNPNTLTRDAGASSLSQGCAAQSCLVQIEKFQEIPPRMRAFDFDVANR